MFPPPPAAPTATVQGNIVLIASPILTMTGLVQPQARLHARLAVDPGVVVKLGGSRIEAEIGAQLIAEGIATITGQDTVNHPVIFTSMEDDRYGAGGTFDTTGDGFDPTGAGTNAPHPGDWGGLYFSPTSQGSIDPRPDRLWRRHDPHRRRFGTFNAIDIRQAKVRVADSILANNAGGGDATDRNGRGQNAAATIYVLGAQP